MAETVLRVHGLFPTRPGFLLHENKGREEWAPICFVPVWHLPMDSPTWEVLLDFPGEEHPVVG